jgi:hypothetical protein
MSDWNESSRIRRDFRHTHGGPEEMPHRKKAKHYDRSKCEHEFNEWFVAHTFRSDVFWYEHKRRYCTKCHKREHSFLSGKIDGRPTGTVVK